MGLPLHLIPDIRKMYGRDPHGKDVIDFDNGKRGDERKTERGRGEKKGRKALLHDSDACMLTDKGVKGQGRKVC